MFGLFTAPAVAETKTETAALDRIIEFAATAWPLPATYFYGWKSRSQRGGKPFESVIRLGGVDECHDSQSPLHRIMDGCHEHYGPELREKLWADTRYRRAIAWVFCTLDAAAIEVAVSAAEGMLAHGYWRPMAATILKARDEGLMGLGSLAVRKMPA